MFHHGRHHGPGHHFGPGWGRPFAGFHHGWSGKRGPWAGPGFGPGFGPGRGGRRFGRGDLKYVILDLVKDQPRHGYDIIRAMEDRFHGLYSPSPGSVYPTLQLLEDQGLVSSTYQEGKRVYAITDEGRRFLTERAETVEDVRTRASGPWGFKLTPELRELADEVGHLGQLIFHQGARGALGDPEKVRRLREAVARARTEIEGIFRDGPSSPDITL